MIFSWSQTGQWHYQEQDDGYTSAWPIQDRHNAMGPVGMLCVHSSLSVCGLRGMAFPPKCRLPGVYPGHQALLFSQSRTQGLAQDDPKVCGITVPLSQRKQEMPGEELQGWRQVVKGVGGWQGVTCSVFPSAKSAQCRHLSHGMASLHKGIRACKDQMGSCVLSSWQMVGLNI